METKFTKGQWEWEYDDLSKTGLKIISGDELLVDFVGGENLTEAEANAKLIAVAPELYQCLYELTNCIQGINNGSVILSVPIELSQKIGETLRKIQ